MRIAKVVACFLILFALFGFSYADSTVLPSVTVDFGGEQTGEGVASTVQILILMTILSLAPSIVIMTTCFTRIIIILSFLRKALGLQSTPPNQVLIGLALFLTFFIMAPAIAEIKTNAYDPLVRGEVTQIEAYDAAMAPLRTFMFRQVRSKDLALFVKLAGDEKPDNLQDIPTTALIPAFMISELKTGFEVGFLLFLPFIVIDMVISSALMSLGMMMLPPVMISLPFKVLLFVAVDGWNLIIQSILTGIR
jgi:flagellar biosynthetic protein FliP